MNEGLVPRKNPVVLSKVPSVFAEGGTAETVTGDHTNKDVSGSEGDAGDSSDDALERSNTSVGDLSEAPPCEKLQASTQIIMTMNHLRCACKWLQVNYEDVSSGA